VEDLTTFYLKRYITVAWNNIVKRKKWFSYYKKNTIFLKKSITYTRIL